MNEKIQKANNYLNIGVNFIKNCFDKYIGSYVDQISNANKHLNDKNLSEKDRYFYKEERREGRNGLLRTGVIVIGGLVAINKIV